MSDNPDTIDTILDDMLNEGHTGPADSLEWVQAKMKFYAGRIKAAWERQCSQSWHHREMEELILRHEKEVAELKKLIDAAVYAYDPTKAGKSELPDGSAYALEAFKANKAKEPTTVGNAAAKKRRRIKADGPSKILHDYWRVHYEV